MNKKEEQKEKQKKNLDNLFNNPIMKSLQEHKLKDVFEVFQQFSDSLGFEDPLSSMGKILDKISASGLASNSNSNSNAAKEEKKDKKLYLLDVPRSGMKQFQLNVFLKELLKLKNPMEVNNAINVNEIKNKPFELPIEGKSEKEILDLKKKLEDLEAKVEYK